MSAESIIVVIAVVSVISIGVGLLGKFPSFIEKNLSSRKRKRYLESALNNEKYNSPLSENYHDFITKGIQHMSKEAIIVCDEEKQ